jgi:hypothetical protein
MKNAKGQEVQRVIPEDFFAHAKETMSAEEFAKLEEAYKHSLEQTREKIAAIRAKIGRPALRMRNGGDPTKVIWPTVEEYCAEAKEAGVSPEDLEKMKAHHKEMLEAVKNGTAEIEILSTDSEGRVTAAGMTSSRVVMRSEQFTDPWTGKPRVFTDEEKKKYGLKYGITFTEDIPQESRECSICHRLNEEHSRDEIRACWSKVKEKARRDIKE